MGRTKVMHKFLMIDDFDDFHAFVCVGPTNCP